MGHKGRALWREHARSPEFAPGVDVPPDALARRDFLRLMGASAALAGASACERAPHGTIRPYAVEPEQAVPGNALFFATSLLEDGYATGVLVESHEGRPTKIEGNSEHPASLGATSAAGQAAVLDLYDPDRARAVTRAGLPTTWEAARDVLLRGRGDGLHLLLEATSSPLVGEQVARLRAVSPRIDVRWHAPRAPVNAWSGSRLALGRVLETHAELRAARVVLALDSDFLVVGPASLRLARQFAEGRRLGAPADGMSRLYSVEPALSVTGMSADHRLRVRACDVVAVACAIALALVDVGVPLPAAFVAALPAPAASVAPHAAWTRAVARDLASHRGAGAILVGEGQPALVHALGHALNAALGNVGHAITYADSPIVDAGTDAFDLAPLARSLDAGDVRTLVIAGGNPVYAARADLDLAARFALARESLYLGPYVDETAIACRWFVPQAHALESWGDARAFDGTVSFQQPLVAPMFGRRTTSELLASLLGDAPSDAHAILRSHWQTLAWEGALERGFVAHSAFERASAPAVQYDALAEALARLAPPVATASALELVIRPNPYVREGASTNNGWLMELPHPVTRQSWGNAALLSAATAGRLGIRDGDVLDLSLAGRSVRAPALVAPGHADETVSLAAGYGRSGEGETLARGVGANANALRTDGWFASGLAVALTGEREDLALEQEHGSLEGRDDEILLHRTLDEVARDPTFAEAHDARPLALYEPHAPKGPQWGMVIDLNACTGCAACVVACQAENNVPIVGKAGVVKGRAMHWLRIDRYFAGPADEPSVLLEPMLCQHCEKAPCEYVCPVNATTHSADGLNQMVYNRCVGTRFCSNNCPYKVRRFNWFNYHADEGSTVAAQHNPDVTVRARGVMEKCTYCVQRIREAGIRAAVARRPLVDGDVVTACEQACPSRAITFGDITDASSRVAKLRTSERRFAVLDALGTVPRTRYLARVTNPNPELA